ncbi:Phosphoserine phosphatase [Sanguibacter gelidistatuariae]|uniref:Phosphoserine phosphatase n=1 Tax=Sanguibacter gelidistatuariae TaxID=1814289 RepID=A0A1G6NGL6_9MICO|nr:HAD family hydrolase [Sanguibacter gelidistatuariae]SDC66437.1 Phosphoserine phosphatase [Sanguibacter gelidistatuariae]
MSALIPAPLPSWTGGAAKQRILAVVDAMTDPTSPSFVEERRRIATFDNDGTLWCEKPAYVQFMLLLNRWQQMAAEDPSRRETQPYKAAVEGDRAWFADVYAHVADLLQGAGDAYAGLTPDEFDAAVADFFDRANHPRFGVPLHHLTYTPMVELVHLLRGRGFKVLITTGGGRDFVRVVSEEIYGLPREAIIGSSPTLEYRDGTLYRTAQLSGGIDDGPGKPVHIYERTGYVPAFAAGNADGDIQMLESARFGLLVHHDDDVREYAYDTGSENALSQAGRDDWLVVSMKDDFAQVFPPDT